MNKPLTPVLLVICGVLAGGFSNTVFAEFNLDKLKAIAEKAKAYQDKINQESQASSSTTNPEAADQAAKDHSIMKLPEMSAANPDVVGLTLGVTGLTDARQVFKNYEPKLKILEDTVLGGAQPYVGVLRGYADNCGYLCYRHELFAKLAAPEAGARVIAAMRRLQFTSKDATSLPNMLDALRKKYGEGIYVKQSSPAQLESYWAWSSNGRPIALSAGHPCADARAVAPLWANTENQVRAEQYAQPALKGNCSSIVFVTLIAKNDVVTAATLQAVDVGGIVRSTRIAAEAQAASVNKQNQINREKAGQQRAPKL